jgi:hypothetical protein
MIHISYCLNIELRLEFQRISAQQTQVQMRLRCGSFDGFYCSNIELGGLTWALLSDPIICMHRLTRS